MIDRFFQGTNTLLILLRSDTSNESFGLSFGNFPGSLITFPDDFFEIFSRNSLFLGKFVYERDQVERFSHKSVPIYVRLNLILHKNGLLKQTALLPFVVWICWRLILARWDIFALQTLLLFRFQFWFFLPFHVKYFLLVALCWSFRNHILVWILAWVWVDILRSYWLWSFLRFHLFIDDAS